MCLVSTGQDLSPGEHTNRGCVGCVCTLVIPVRGGGDRQISLDFAGQPAYSNW